VKHQLAPRRRCGASAQALVILTTGSDLVFCEHHARQYQTVLKPVAVLIEQLAVPRQIDQTSRHHKDSSAD
jgi:hypothetical protein